MFDMSLGGILRKKRHWPIKKARVGAFSDSPNIVLDLASILEHGNVMATLPFYSNAFYLYGRVHMLTCRGMPS